MKVTNFLIGDCGAASNGFGMTCNGIGGQPAATLAEFTLGGSGSSDFYDLSNVDGNTMSMTIRPIPGQYTSVNNPSLGKYNCGTVSCLKDSETSKEQNCSYSKEKNLPIGNSYEFENITKA